MSLHRVLSFSLFFTVNGGGTDASPLQLRGNSSTLPSSVRRKLVSGGCDKNTWHPEPNNSNGCSNSLDYPAEWEGVAGLFHTTFEECCEFFRPNEECIFYDACEDGEEVVVPIPAPGGTCTSNEWHPDMTTRDGCSNSLDYPEDWEGNSMYLYKTPQECCDMFFKNKECIIHKMCVTGSETSSETETASCNDNKWHPDITRRNGCSNSADYPVAWDKGSLTSHYLFDTSDECCSTFFAKEDKCNVYHDCESQSSSYVLSPATSRPITSSPTSVPKPSRSPTLPPTNKPSTRAPTVSPTIPPIQYYVVFSTGMCVPRDVFAPYWLTDKDFFFDYTECCKSSFNTNACLAVSPTVSPTTLHPTTNSPTLQPTSPSPVSSSPIQPGSTLSPTNHPITRAPSVPPTQSPSTSPSTTPVTYYAAHTTGLCIPRTASAPYWLTEKDFYLDYAECCKNSWNTNECLSKSPTARPTTLHPTNPPSLQPTSRSPSSTPTTSPTSHPSLSPTSSKPTTLSPTTAEPTNAPTCHSAPWHPSEDYSKCSNSFEYDPGWNYKPYKETYLLGSSKLCCEKFFDSWGKECVIEDICKTSSPTKSPVTSSPTKSPVTSSPTTHPTNSPVTNAPISTCSSALWHPADDYSKCTNGFDYDNAWNFPPVKDAYLHEDLSGCCEAFFEVWGKECVVEDICQSGNGMTTSTANNGVMVSTIEEVVGCEAKWHPTEAFDSCTNSPEYPDAWDLSHVHSKYLLPTKSDCCNAFFFLNGKDCMTRDSCSGTVTVMQAPTGSPSKSSSEHQCKSNLWHPPTNPQKCTNDLDYPDSWLWPGMRDEYMFETAEDCCEKYFFVRGKDCVVDDVCLGTVLTLKPPTEAPTNRPTSSPTNKDTTCEMRSWHPPTNYQKCTNDLDYPESWLWPDMRDEYMFETAEDCCKKYFFVRGKDCVVEDMCTDTVLTLKPPTEAPTNRPTSSPTNNVTPCEMRSWHPLTDYTKCTNDLNYPESWNWQSMRQEYMFDSRDDCCEKYFFVLGKDCIVENSCSGDITTLKSPTSSPTQASKLPTGAPMTVAPTTLAPTKSRESLPPTSPPSIHPTNARYYSDQSNGMCKVDGPNTPSWTNKFYTDWEECCKAGWVFDVCMAAIPTNLVNVTELKDEESTTTSTTTSTSSQNQYYSNPSNGMCATVDENTPSWISTFYTEWAECCKVGWVYDKCMAESPVS